MSTKSLSLLRRKKMAELADLHELYQRAVQDTEAELDFIEDTWNSLRDRPAELLCEDFCGTAITACDWVRRDGSHQAIGVDIDPDVLEWAVENNLSTLTPEEQERVDLVCGDVLVERPGGCDIILAMNFSYFVFLEREALREYFRSVRDSLVEDGLLFLDVYGGYDAPRELEESRDCDGFTYVWDQARFNPIDSCMTCHIHFRFPDRSRVDRAFTYHWRLWTLPEIREVLLEAGFSLVAVYWEGTDEEANEGNGIYEPREQGEADAGWICYVVAQR